MAQLDLTRKQREVLKYLLSVVDSDSVSRASCRQICRALPASMGAIILNLNVLEAKGYLSRLERGSGTRPTSYKIHREYADA